MTRSWVCEPLDALPRLHARAECRPPGRGHAERLPLLPQIIDAG